MALVLLYKQTCMMTVLWYGIRQNAFCPKQNIYKGEGDCSKKNFFTWVSDTGTFVYCTNNTSCCNEMWKDAISQETKNIVAFDGMEESSQQQNRYQFVKYNIIFDMNMEEFCLVARLVVWVFMIDIPTPVISASVDCAYCIDDCRNNTQST